MNATHPDAVPVARPTPADLAFMGSREIAALISEGLAILADRGDVHLLDRAQADRIGGEE